MSQQQGRESGGWSFAAASGTLPFETAPLKLPPRWSAPAADAPLTGIWERLDPEKIRCLGSSCGDALHCFRLSKRQARTLGPGTCRACQQPLVSMSRVALQDLSDVNYTFSALQLEYIRHYFWHTPLSELAIEKVRKRAMVDLKSMLVKRVTQRIGAAQPYHDGWQTPTARSKATAFDYAMHAVAACCRACAEYWHGIPRGRPLTDDEVLYLAELMRLYLVARLPGLGPAGPDGPLAAEVSNVHDIRDRIKPVVQAPSVTRPHAS